jgi:hypothetical protein
MGQNSALAKHQTIVRRKKGNNALTNDLVQLSLDQYKKDQNINILREELQKIALICSRSKPRN